MAGVTVEIRTAGGAVERRTTTPCAHADKVVAPAARPRGPFLEVGFSEFCTICGRELAAVHPALINPGAQA